MPANIARASPGRQGIAGKYGHLEQHERTKMNWFDYFICIQCHQRLIWATHKPTFNI